MTLASVIIVLVKLFRIQRTLYVKCQFVKCLEKELLFIANIYLSVIDIIIPPLCAYLIGIHNIQGDSK